jgi:hypothetical protein
LQSPGLLNRDLSIFEGEAAQSLCCAINELESQQVSDAVRCDLMKMMEMKLEEKQQVEVM